MKKFVKSVIVVLVCMSVLFGTMQAFAATATTKTGTTAGGGYGKADVTCRINGDDWPTPIPDAVYAYTKCNKELKTYVSAKIYGKNGTEEGSASKTEITTSRVSVTVTANDSKATKGTSSHKVTSADYGNFSMSLSCTFNQ